MSGKTLRRLREAAGLTQGELAKKLGVALNTVSRWELGRMKIAKRSEKSIEFVLKEGVR
jgi:transcriptional regulator with XRE-family HTH domain